MIISEDFELGVARLDPPHRYSWAPKDDGVVTPALTPLVKLLPTSPQIAVSYWALTAQVRNIKHFNDFLYHQYFPYILISPVTCLSDM